jgi:hypothetical protein
LNNFNLGGASILSGIQENDMQRKWEAAAAKANSIGGLVGGAFGIGGGLMNGMRKPQASAPMHSSIGGGGGWGSLVPEYGGSVSF